MTHGRLGCVGPMPPTAPGSGSSRSAPADRPPSPGRHRPGRPRPRGDSPRHRGPTLACARPDAGTRISSPCVVSHRIGASEHPAGRSVPVISRSSPEYPSSVALDCVTSMIGMALSPSTRSATLGPTAGSCQPGPGSQASTRRFSTSPNPSLAAVGLVPRAPVKHGLVPGGRIALERLVGHGDDDLHRRAVVDADTTRAAALCPRPRAA